MEKKAASGKETTRVETKTPKEQGTAGAGEEGTPGLMEGDRRERRGGDRKAA